MIFIDINGNLWRQKWLKMRFKKNIYGLSTDEEIVDFVKFRLKELEDGSMETTVGQNYTDTFRENIYL